ncbi:PLP-dependent aminotransferase family protein [Cupriavidus taiwanensis]|uniref:TRANSCRIPTION REGULATOR PROTEIN GntR family n=1 Tax=Cupriavidus taiwanensis TaxID=164546 RepID=A0A375BMR9_9BURK|nr:PLP-dependent aminotransferase family protein [Cupriavidus taiwanensis]MDK3026385.1 PLP-dependent aminotransferase family protein [Cupriavidus taiwanensis]SOY47959.1 putative TRANSCRIPTION REGULATOR PROTEIN; GntR family [Cupriavidus taiwanensis]
MDAHTRKGDAGGESAAMARQKDSRGGRQATAGAAPARALQLVLPPTERLPDPVPSAQMTLVGQLTEWARMRIDERVFRAGMRMPSIRQLAQEKGISRFTVVEAYERLVALGYLESRRGSGFYVRERAPAAPAAPVARDAAPPARKIDVTWLLRSMFHTAEAHKAPGLGFLPNDWLDGELIASALRGLGRQPGNHFLASGTPQGFLPLRQQLRTRLEELEIRAGAEQIVLTSGITQALDLIARLYLQPGDAVLVGDPAWFVMFGRFAAQGAQVIGVPYTGEGPDLEALERIVQAHRPRLFVINSVLHNPTGTSLSAAKAFQLLRLAEQYDFLIVEDDIYCDLCPPGHAATRLASLDQLRRVIYLGSFSKTLAANLRVGFIAAHPEMAAALTDSKLLAGLATPEINERVLYKVLTEGHYRKHVERVRTRLDRARDDTRRALERLGLRLFPGQHAGMYLWADSGRDSNAIATAGHEEGYLFAPGSLFSPSQMPSGWMRFNVASSGDPDMLRFLARQLERL